MTESHLMCYSVCIGGMRVKPVAYEGKEKYIFISYAHKDSDTVMRIMNSLQAEGYRIWYDDGIIPGSEWPENIAMHLNDAAMVIAMISPNSMASHNCRREINFALSKQKPFLSVVLEPTEMSLGMEMQLSAQNIVMRQNYNDWTTFISKIMLCPGLEPCKIGDGEELPSRYLPIGMQMESEAGQFVMGAPAKEEEPKKKRSPLIAVCAVLAAALIGLGGMMFLGNDSTGSGQPVIDNQGEGVNNVQPSMLPQDDYAHDFEPQGKLLMDGAWATGVVEVYAVDDRHFEILLTDYLLPNFYTTSEIPGNRDPYWNVCLVPDNSDMYSLNVYGVSTGYFDRDCLYMKGNATITCTQDMGVKQQGNTFLLTLELDDSITWNTDDLQCIYVNLGLEGDEGTDHYTFWR